MHNLFKLFVVASCLLAVACSNSRTDVESDLGIKGAPDWVNEGTKAVDNDKGQLIHGTGSAPDMGDQSLQRATADGRARAEVARVVSTIVKSSIKDYSTSNGAAVDSSIEREIINTTDSALNGSEIVGRWRDKRTGTVYSIAELNLEKLDSAIERAGKLSTLDLDKFKSDINANFDRFMKEQK
ncbi:LPP20 family lipoprotein [Agaribacterium haliotis]|uniref:LPP20 family lipoprotein n=1 Tax=Agaribacterium haliotis TaxID=2013869 RepID=UPI000BB52CED|nr:LPP20 family lipoprotein [Agaribacterium haliotis]